MSEFSPNPDRYSHIALPVAQADANKRLRDFFEDLGEIRKKHGIPDVHCVVQQNIETERGEAPGLCAMHFGDQRNSLQMCSYALGYATGEHQKFVLAARSQGMKLGSDIAMKEVKEHHKDLFGE